MATSQFVSPADFHAGLLALGFNVTQEEADVLANVLETDEAGNINLASLQQEGSPLVEQLAALAESAPELAPEAAPATEPQPTEAALAAIDAMERGDEAAFADALGRMPPSEAEALQQALELQQEPPTEAPAGAPPPSAVPRAKPRPQRTVSPPERAITYGGLADTFPVTRPTGESASSRDYGAVLSSLQPRSKPPSNIPRRASKEPSPTGDASRSPLASRDVSPPRERPPVEAFQERSPIESEAGSHFSTDDLAAMPAEAQPLIALLLKVRVRVRVPQG